MMFIKNLSILMACSLLSTALFAQHYVAPPTESTSGYAPVISDELMEQCIETYNQAKWLSDELSQTSVNPYSSYEVNAYNEKIFQHQQMINWFNNNCAEKQSYSACKKAQELNRKNGLPENSCN